MLTTTLFRRTTPTKTLPKNKQANRTKEENQKTLFFTFEDLYSGVSCVLSVEHLIYDMVLFSCFLWHVRFKCNSNFSVRGKGKYLRGGTVINNLNKP